MVSVAPNWDAPGFFFAMEWSGQWEGSVRHVGSVSDDGMWLQHVQYQPPPNDLAIKVGPKVANLVLAPKESLDMPRVHIGFFEGGFEAGTNALRRYILQCITPQHKNLRVTPPVVCVQWPGIRVFTEEDIYRQADTAAHLGVEYFVFDTEWYGRHPDSIGTWEPDAQKLTRGLEALAEHVRSKGMGFGLFFDPELAAPGTKMLREHPEFFYPLGDLMYMPQGSRVVNFGLPEACRYVTELLSRYIDQYELEYIHWELDTPLEPFWSEMDPTGKAQFVHYEGLYRVWRELIGKYPHVMMHFAAQGGHRQDLGTFRHSHVCWAYEVQSDPHLCHRMQLGGSLFIPSLYLGCNVGPEPKKEHLGLDDGLPDLSFISRMAGTLFVNGVLEKLPPEQANRAKHWIGVYKKIRHLLVKDYYRLLVQPQSEADWDAGQFCDGTYEGVVFVFRYAGATDRQNLFLRALDFGASYIFCDEKNGQEQIYQGTELINQGVLVNLPPNSAKLYSYRKEGFGGGTR